MEFGFYLPNNGPTAQPDDLSEIAKRGDRWVTIPWWWGTTFWCPSR